MKSEKYETSGEKGQAFKATLKGAKQTSDRVIVFEGDFAGDGLVRVEFSALGMPTS